jgi:beta-glucosidase
MPWRDDVDAVLLTWFGGQEFGHALADVLTGDVEPGGRLPTTWGAALTDVPVTDVQPLAGALAYDEGLHIGYRAWLQQGRTPAYPFGHGLGYTTWRHDGLAVEPRASGDGADGPDDDAVLDACVAMTNTGARTGRAVVQVYASRPGSAVDRPDRWLVGFASATVEPGASAVVRVPIARRAFEHWSVTDHAWVTEPGTFVLHAGADVATTPLSARVER